MHQPVFHRVMVFDVKDMSTVDIKNNFLRYGEVLDVYKPRSLHTNDFHGYAIITYSSLREASKAAATPGVMMYAPIQMTDLPRSRRSDDTRV